LVLESAATFDRKQRDYGPTNIGDFGELGVLVRCHDKVSRLKNLLWVHLATPANESVEDSWLDLGVYAFIARLVRRNLWPRR
jgi:hypothetical protein